MELRGSVKKGIVGITGLHLELFAGCGRHTRALRRLGMPCLAFDFRTDPILGDLCNRHVQDCICSWIRQGLIASIWLGTPCTTWCVALNRFPKCRLRSREELFGLASLNEAQRKRVMTGNATAKFSVKIIHMCVAQCIPVALENPTRSLLFEHPAIVRLRKHRAHVEHRFTMCAFGTRWRKSTDLPCWFCACHHLDSCRCSGRSGLCAYTKKPHLQLQGKSDSGPNWTTIAAAYPARLCRLTASMMATAAIDAATADRLW
mgnify:CR=1 FL=1